MFPFADYILHTMGSNTIFIGHDPNYNHHYTMEYITNCQVHKELDNIIHTWETCIIPPRPRAISRAVINFQPKYRLHSHPKDLGPFLSQLYPRNNNPAAASPLRTANVNLLSTISTTPSSLQGLDASNKNSNYAPSDTLDDKHTQNDDSGNDTNNENEINNNTNDNNEDPADRPPPTDNPENPGATP